jgi:hypothetical protein
MKGDADSASSIFEFLSFLVTGYRRMSFASYGLRMSRMASKSAVCFLLLSQDKWQWSQFQADPLPKFAVDRGGPSSSGRIPPSHVLLNVRCTGFCQRKILFVLRPASKFGHRDHSGQRSDQVRGRNHCAPTEGLQKNAVISSSSNSAFSIRKWPAHQFRPHRRRPLYAGTNHRATLPRRGFGGPRRNGRSLPRRRPDPRPGRGLKISSRYALPGCCGARAVSRRSTHGPASFASQRLPHVRHRRSRRNSLSDHGVC